MFANTLALRRRRKLPDWRMSMRACMGRKGRGQKGG